MIVELVGPTASGKSTLARAAVARLRADGLAVCMADDVILGRWAARFARGSRGRGLAIECLTLPWLFLEVARQPAFSFHLAAISLRHGEHLALRLNALRNAGRRLGVAARLRRAQRAGEAIVVDEGLTQFVDILARTDRLPRASEVAAYARRLPPGTAIVRVTASLEARVARLHERGHARLRTRDDAALRRYAASGEAVLDRLAAVPALAGRIERVEAAATEDGVERAAETLAGVIRSLLLAEGRAGALARR